MHWWKRQILYFLSLVLLNCSGNPSQPEISRVINPTEELTQLFEEWPSDLSEKIDSLTPLIIQQGSAYKVYNSGNDIEPNSILITGDNKEAIAPFSKYFSEKAISTSRYDEYYIWGVSAKNGVRYTVSQYPHPVLQWVIEIKMGSSEN